MLLSSPRILWSLAVRFHPSKMYIITKQRWNRGHVPPKKKKGRIIMDPIAETWKKHLFWLRKGRSFGGNVSFSRRSNRICFQGVFHDERINLLDVGGAHMINPRSKGPNSWRHVAANHCRFAKFTFFFEPPGWKSQLWHVAPIDFEISRYGSKEYESAVNIIQANHMLHSHGFDLTLWLREFPGTPRNGTPFWEASHTTPINSWKFMGSLWGALWERATILGGAPGNSLDVEHRWSTLERAKWNAKSSCFPSTLPNRARFLSCQGGSLSHTEGHVLIPGAVDMKGQEGVKNQNVMIGVMSLICIYVRSIQMILMCSCSFTSTFVFRIIVAPAFLMCKGVWNIFLQTLWFMSSGRGFELPPKKIPGSFGTTHGNLEGKNIIKIIKGEFLS